MAERRVEHLEHIAVDRRHGTVDVQTDLLAERAAEVAYHAWKGGEPIGDRPHAAGERLVIEAMRQAGCLTVRLLQFDQPFRQKALTLVDPALGLDEGGQSGVAEGVAREEIAYPANGFGRFLLMALQPNQRLGEGLQPPRGDERLPGKS